MGVSARFHFIFSNLIKFGFYQHKTCSMLRQLILVLAVLISGNSYGQYKYDEQRQKEADRYLESIKAGQQYSNRKSGDFKMNEQAVQEMTDMWNRRAGKKTSAEFEAERTANKKKWEANREQREAKQKAAEELRANTHLLKEVAADVVKMNAPEFSRAGFSASEANVLAMNSVGTVKTGNETKVKIYYDELSAGALEAYSEFLKKEATGNFEEMMDLVADFDIAGYTAVKSLEKLKKRFPEKKDLIDLAMPFHGINFWKEVGVYTILNETITASAYLNADDAQKAEMNNLLKSWLNDFPQLLGHIYYGYGDNKTFKMLLKDLIINQDKEFLHHIALSAAIALPRYPSIIAEDTKDIPSLRQLLSFDDFEIIRRYHNISGIQAIEKVRVKAFMKDHYDFFEVSDFEADLYTEELKKYADGGDAEAMNSYGLHTLKGYTKDAKDAAYLYLKKAADAGLPYTLKLLGKHKNLKQLGINDWGVYKRELEFKAEFNEKERVYIKGAWGDETPTFFGKDGPFTPDKKLKIPHPDKPNDILYYYGSIKNGKAEGFGNAVDASDNLYSGYWMDNQLHGTGELRTGDGHSFEGMFANGKKNGYVYYNYLKKGKGKFHSGFYEDDKLIYKSEDYISLRSWDMVGNKYWQFSDIPARYTNMTRIIDNGQLNFKSTDEGYSWSITELNKIKVAAYSYGVYYKVNQKGYDKGTCGILIEIDEGNGKEKSKLLYMINPGKQTFTLRLYNPNTDEWTYFTSPNSNGAWMASTNFKGYENRLQLDKLGDDIFLYLNGTRVFSLKISDSGKPLHRFAGIGVVQDGVISGSSTDIFFR